MLRADCSLNIRLKLQHEKHSVPALLLFMLFSYCFLILNSSFILYNNQQEKDYELNAVLIQKTVQPLLFDNPGNGSTVVIPFAKNIRFHFKEFRAIICKYYQNLQTCIIFSESLVFANYYYKINGGLTIFPFHYFW